jgi:nucleoside-diphosphate-sugar epimerase
MLATPAVAGWREGENTMILVTGAGGFIGGQVCRLLSTRGYAVVAIDRRFATPEPYSQFSGDIGSTDFLTEVIQTGSFDTIIHLAAVLNTASRQQPDEALRVNIGSSLTLLQLAARCKVQKFIFGSSISVYGAKSFAEYGEVSEAQPAAPNTIYGVSKRFVELAGQDYHEQGTFQFVAVRIAMVVGPGAVNTSTPWRSHIFERLRTRQPTRIDLPFACTERLPLIHVADVAEVIQRLIHIERPIYSIYNTPAENWTVGDLAEYIHTLNNNVEVTYSPARSRGDPEAINGQRFTDEFDYQPVPLRQHLRQLV